MALYRLETKIINRQNRGRSVIPSAAYRSGSILHKAAYRSANILEHAVARLTFNYQARAQEVVHTEILAPENGPSWLQTQAETSADMSIQRDMRERLWNTIETVEKRKDSQLAREFIAALPKELNREQQIELVRSWCKAEFVDKGFVVDFALHRSKNGKNPHAHILCTTRPVEGEGFGKKPSTAGKFNGRGVVGKQGKSDLVAWRETWGVHANTALEKAGRPERVDHRSLKDRGIDQIPQPKIGVAATAMKRRGVAPDPERFQLVRYVKSLNFARPWLRSIEKTGEVRQQGMGATWWERSLVMVAQAGRAVRETVLDTWTKMLQSRQPGGHGIPPQDRGPDLGR
jgi:ATP-dependent exoDNAse (exonuclease V) alpha subunit